MVSCFAIGVELPITLQATLKMYICMYLYAEFALQDRLLLGFIIVDRDSCEFFVRRV